VRQRLLGVLADEGIMPIAAEGQSFDPHLHVALEVVPPSDDLPPGHVAAELRRGYMAGERVLRHAEVAVSGQPPDS
jgi:molecular chaperone GrpE